MNLRLLLFPLLLVSIGFFSQTEVVFKYDEAGNQIYRGPVDPAASPVVENAEPSNVPFSAPSFEDQFLQNIRLYPVPVKTVLTIDWSVENDALIDHVSLFQHNSLSYWFRKHNTTTLNRRVEVDMSGLYMGVYVVSFQLKDGRVISKNIIKE